METRPLPEEPVLDAEHFEALSEAHTRNILAVRGVAATHFYTYLEPAAWDLLVTSQQTCAENNQPDAVSAVLLDPATGGWLAQLVPYERPHPDTGVPLEKDETFWWHILHGYSIAASAAIQAEVPSFSMTVPAWSGRVTLPGLGQAILRQMAATEDVREMATITATPDSITIAGCGNTVTLNRTSPNDNSAWQETARITAGNPDEPWGVLLDDTNPYRLTAAPVAPNQDIHQFGTGLHAQPKTEWLDLIKASMDMLVRDHPQIAHSLRREVRSIAPLSFTPQAICLRPYSASGSATTGGAELDFQHFPEITAASLVHEGAHMKYYGMVLERPFVGKTGADRPYLNSPWRSDVRPAAGHLLGIDAFSNVGEFWRERVSGEVWLDSKLSMDIASYEVAFLRTQVEIALGQIDQDDSVLTPEGQAYINEVLKPRIAQLQAEQVQQRVAEAAQEAVDYHIAMWRAHHYALPAEHIGQLVTSWLKGDACPDISDTPSQLVPGTGHYFDLWTTFNRLSIGKPDVFAQLRKNPPAIGDHVQGAQPRDLLNYLHESERAGQAYIYELRGQKTIDPRTIVGLGFALRNTVDMPSSRILREHPHVYKAVLNRLIELDVSRPDPLALARWMAYR